MRTRPILCCLLTWAVVACGDDSTDPGDGDGNGNGNGNGESTVEHYTAAMSVESIVSNTPVVSDATGTTTLDYDTATGNLSYKITIGQMDSITAAHIHGPATPTANAAIRLFLYTAPSGATGLVQGELVSGTIAPGSNLFRNGGTMEDVVRWMRNDSAHVMVHSTRYPNGEIRGQIVPVP